MKKFLSIFLFSIFSLGFSQKIPTTNKTEFSKEALSQKIEDAEGKVTDIKTILKNIRVKFLLSTFGPLGVEIV